MKIVLLANYLPDRQESMQRYAALLEKLLASSGDEVEVVRPRAFFGRLWPIAGGLGKWLGYLDKFVLFRLELGRHLARLRRAGAPFLVHVCDHSNAMYVPWLRGPQLVTCHDLLAVKSALGLVPGQSTGWSGRILQRWILRGLSRAGHVVCDSDATRSDLLALLPHQEATSEVVTLPLSYPFAPLSPEKSRSLLKNIAPAWWNESQPAPRFLFHVGGNQWYKNRTGVLQIFAELRRAAPEETADLKLVVAGKEPTPELLELVRAHGLDDAVLFPGTITDAQLQALYSSAAALLFPSLQEGFGWPVLEALACGCPVITSNRAPMNEVGGNAACYADPEDIPAFAQRLAELLRENPEAAARRREQALAHAAAASDDAFLSRMRTIYRCLLEKT